LCTLNMPRRPTPGRVECCKKMLERRSEPVPPALKRERMISRLSACCGTDRQATPDCPVFDIKCVNFRKFLIEDTKPNLKKFNSYVERSLMLVTALSPVIGYDKASKMAHYAMDNDVTLKAAASKLGFVTEAEFDRVVDPKKMVKPNVASGASATSAA
jgi:fumarase hydratase-like protein